MPSSTEKVDTLIVGQGLAGTALAWELERRGKDYLIVDEGVTPTSSLVAAGLITPVTGTRFTVASHFDKLAHCAGRFYRAVEAHLATRFYYDQPALRLVYGDDETDRFLARAEVLIESGHVRHEPDGGAQYLGEPTAFVMPHAARLFTSVYLKASRDYFSNHGRLVQARIDPDDISVTDECVKPGPAYPDANRLIFCGGHQDQFNRWVPRALFNRAKGELLTVKLGVKEARTVHACKSWLCPTSEDSTFLFGSTYEHGQFDEAITQSSRTDLIGRLQRFVPGPIEVVAQHYGVRPIAVGRKAIVGRHASASRIAWLNGLGSKGALLSPYLASVLADSVLHHRPIEAPWTGVHVDHAP